MDCHLVCDDIQSKTIHLMAINYENQVIDLFTKQLHHSLYQSDFQIGNVEYTFQFKGG